MKNIFKEYKRLKKEVEELRDYNKRLERENTEGYIRLEEYYEHIKDEEIKWLKSDYTTKLREKRK